MTAAISCCCLARGGITQIAQNDHVAGFGFFQAGFGNLRCCEKSSGYGCVSGGIKGWRRIGLELPDAGVGVECVRGSGVDVDFVQRAFGFHDSMPGEDRKGLWESAHAARSFAVKGSRFHQSQYIRVQRGAHADIDQD